MNAAAHYKEAERLRDCARDAKDGKDQPWKWAAYFHSAAQVHATLALTPTQTGEKHGIIHTESGGTFTQAVCRCGALLGGSGVVSYASMLAVHIRAALAES